MKRNFVVAGAALVIMSLSLFSSPATARLDGPGRDVFVKSSSESCGSELRKNRQNMTAKQIETFCSCMAEAEADMTTAADVAYMATHDAATEDYGARVRALASACNAKAGLK